MTQSRNSSVQIPGPSTSKLPAMDKKNAYSGFLIASAMMACGFFLLQPNHILWIFILNVVLSFFMGIVSVLQWAIYTDTVDYGEWKFGRRRD